jgi:hypothetical protein
MIYVHEGNIEIDSKPTCYELIEGGSVTVTEKESENEFFISFDVYSDWIDWATDNIDNFNTLP